MASSGSVVKPQFNSVDKALAPKRSNSVLSGTGTGTGFVGGHPRCVHDPLVTLTIHQGLKRAKCSVARKFRLKMLTSTGKKSFGGSCVLSRVISDTFVKCARDETVLTKVRRFVSSLPSEKRRLGHLFVGGFGSVKTDYHPTAPMDWRMK